MIKTRQFSEEVLFAETDIVKIGSEEISFLKEKAKSTCRQRIRLCIHKNSEDAVHEMIIVHPKGAYVRPHKHINKYESFYLIEGEAYLLLFTHKGEVEDVIKISEYRDKKKFYLRIPKGVYHTLIIVSDWLVFHETTPGPFRREDTVFPSWAPEENDNISIEKFLIDLKNKIRV